MVIETFKSLNKFNPEFMRDLFTLRENYNLRRGSFILIPKASNTKALNSFKFRAAFAWNHLPASLKEFKNLSKFVQSIKIQEI